MMKMNICVRSGVLFCLLMAGKKKPFRALTRRRLTEAHLFLTGEVKTFL